MKKHIWMGLKKRLKCFMLVSMLTNNIKGIKQGKEELKDNYALSV
jgi:hypothetical protein